MTIANEQITRATNPKGPRCSIAECNRPHNAKGLCRAHYGRMRRNGDPLMRSNRTPDGEAQRYLEQVVGFDGMGCLKWPYNTDSNGYGRIRFKGRDSLVHRVVCELAHGAPPTPRYHAAHLCGKGSQGCCSPKHLAWATAKQNAAHKEQHGTVIRGELSRWARLTESDVLEIRKAFLSGEPQPSLARRFGISQGHVSEIINHKKWAWL